MRTINKKFCIARPLSVSGLMILMNLPVIAQENEGELFNQLYREIISSATDGGAVRMDSLYPEAVGNLKKKSGNPSENSITDAAATEQLKEEINKMVKDIQARHSERIRFMRDGTAK